MTTRSVVAQTAALRLAGADPVASWANDWDQDVAPPTDFLRFWGRTTSGKVIFGQLGFTWVATAVDADLDGVDDRFGCDACLGQAGGSASPDGCP